MQCCSMCNVASVDTYFAASDVMRQVIYTVTGFDATAYTNSLYCTLGQAGPWCQLHEKVGWPESEVVGLR